MRVCALILRARSTGPFEWTISVTNTFEDREISGPVEGLRLAERGERRRAARKRP